MKVWPGKPYPLGASWDGAGVNFALFSEHAEAVELCLFSGKNGHRAAARIRMPERSDLVWHAYLPDVQPGQLYGYRVHGPYEPQAGHRFNPHKLLLDPNARAITGTIHWDDSLYGYTIGHPEQDLSLDERDNAAHLPKCVVVDPAFSRAGSPWPSAAARWAHPAGCADAEPASGLRSGGQSGRAWIQAIR
jgi:glycogen operon protein